MANIDSSSKRETNRPLVVGRSAWPPTAAVTFFSRLSIAGPVADAAAAAAAAAFRRPRQSCGIPRRVVDASAMLASTQLMLLFLSVRIGCQSRAARCDGASMRLYSISC